MAPLGLEIAGHLVGVPAQRAVATAIDAAIEKAILGLEIAGHRVEAVLQ